MNWNNRFIITQLYMKKKSNLEISNFKILKIKTNCRTSKS